MTSADRPRRRDRALRLCRTSTGWQCLRPYRATQTDGQWKRTTGRNELRRSLVGQPPKPTSARNAWQAVHTVPRGDDGYQPLVQLLFRCRIHRPLFRGRGVSRPGNRDLPDDRSDRPEKAASYEAADVRKERVSKRLVERNEPGGEG